MVVGVSPKPCILEYTPVHDLEEEVACRGFTSLEGNGPRFQGFEFSVQAFRIWGFRAYGFRVSSFPALAFGSLSHFRALHLPLRVLAGQAG